MKNKGQLSLIILLFVIIFNNPIFGQDPFDCITAIEVCNNAAISINYEEVEGSVEEQISDICNINSLPASLLDDNTVWFKYQFKSSGNFLFTISSVLENDDIDFVVFKSELKSCEDLASIRCMFTGPNINMPNDSVCTGPTGLAISSIDNVETPGCSEGDDNFLAPLEVNAGDVLYLAVLAFGANNNYKIEHNGSAEISCMPLSINEVPSEDIVIYPNPFNDKLYVEISKNSNVKHYLELFNSAGKSILSQSFKNSINLNMGAFQNGMYYVKIVTDDFEVYYEKIIKI